VSSASTSAPATAGGKPTAIAIEELTDDGRSWLKSSLKMKVAE